MKRNAWFRKIMVMVLLLVTVMGAVVPLGANACNFGNEWEDNVMVENPLDYMVKKKKNIVSVTFLDTLEDAPEKPWHLGTEGARDSVQGWIDWKGGKGYVYFAAEGGINGKYACDELFMGCEGLKEIKFNGAFHTDEAESMVSMFYQCYDLKEINLYELNTSNVTSMYQMFRGCADLKELDVRGMDTSNVENMGSMFSSCIGLKELDLSSFDTSNVTNMSYMLSACTELKEVNVSNFDTSNVTHIAGMFRWCSKLKTYDFSNWDVSNVTSYAGFMNDGMKINGKKWENFFK